MESSIPAIILAQIGGDEFLKIGKAEYKYFRPEVVSSPIQYPSYGLRIEIKNAVMLIIYNQVGDDFFVECCKGCKHYGKIYSSVYYDMLISIIETETDEKFPNLECPAIYDEVTVTPF